MEFNAARMKQPRDFGGETVRMHEDDLVEAARHDRDVKAVHRRRWWPFRRYRGRHTTHA